MVHRIKFNTTKRGEFEGTGILQGGVIENLKKLRGFSGGKLRNTCKIRQKREGTGNKVISLNYMGRGLWKRVWEAR